MKILILSPHTDDAEIGCGGSIIKFLERGNDIMWIVFSAAEESLPEFMPRDTLKKEFLKVVKYLELDENNYIVHDFKVRHLNEKRQIILEDLIKIRRKFGPELVLIPSVSDYHQDHQVIANEAIRAFKTNASIIGYELPWNHITFDTQLFIRLDKTHIEEKCKLLKFYESQISTERGYFDDDYVLGLARVRGTQCSSRYAEAFEVIRWIINDRDSLH